MVQALNAYFKDQEKELSSKAALACKSYVMQVFRSALLYSATVAADVLMAIRNTEPLPIAAPTLALKKHECGKCVPFTEDESSVIVPMANINICSPDDYVLCARYGRPPVLCLRARCLFVAG